MRKLKRRYQRQWVAVNMEIIKPSERKESRLIQELQPVVQAIIDAMGILTPIV